MRLISTCALFLCLSSLPAIAQNNDAKAAPAEVSTASVDYTALRENIAQQNKVLQDQLAVQRAILKQKQTLLKNAQKMDASNRKMEAEKKKISAEVGNLDKQREALKSSQGQVESASVSK